MTAEPIARLDAGPTAEKERIDRCCPEVDVCCSRAEQQTCCRAEAKDECCGTGGEDRCRCR